MEKNTGSKVFLSSAIGAFIGSLIALEFGRRFWWTGTIIGFVLGYLLFRVRNVGRAIASVWGEMSKIEITKAGLKTVGEKAGFCFVMLLNFPFLVIMINWIGPEEWITHEDMIGYSLGYEIFQVARMMMSFLIGVAGFIVSVLALGIVFADLKTIKEDFTKVYLPIFFVYHFPIFLFKVIKIIPDFVATVLKAIWLMFSFVAKFVWKVFLKIHSETRLLCGIDSAIGATVGYFVGSALIGALVGGVLGLVNYELISKRVLLPRNLI